MDCHYAIINLFRRAADAACLQITFYKTEREIHIWKKQKKKKKKTTKNKTKKKKEKKRRENQPIIAGRTWKGTGLNLVAIPMSCILISKSYFNLSLFIYNLRVLSFVC